jgi:hypothetical protein
MGRPNAFKHAYFAILHCKTFNRQLAQRLADEHEYYDPSRAITSYSLDTQMDLWNNAQGFQLFDANPNRSNDDFSYAIYGVAINGNLRYIPCCRENSTIPFQLNLSKYKLRFPTTASDVKRQYPKAKESNAVFLSDSTDGVDVRWLFKESIRDLRKQPYGVIITLSEKGKSIDSLQKVFESEYKMPFKPLPNPTSLSRNEYFETDTSLRVMHPMRHVLLAIHRRKTWPTTGFKFTNDVIISICYRCSLKEEERFVFKQGRIQEDD